jgi:hypothetical protein
MRRLALFALPLVWLACDRPLRVEESAVHVDVSFDFNAGCIGVLARDKADPDKRDEKQALVLGRDTRRANFAVFRKADWSPTIEIIVSARERTCEGPVVATSEVGVFTLDRPGTQRMDPLLHAPDEDNDSYVPLASGGTDCDDDHDGSNPSVTTEVCDGHDNDCRDGIDDGFEFKNFFLDGDGDGIGAGNAVPACAAPPDHVQASGDCDDADGTRAPNKPEVCDQRDNNCVNGIDDGLPTRAYYRDEDGDTFGLQSDVQVRCSAPTGYVASANGFDCDDKKDTVKPGATETCNGIDDNCGQGIDEGVKTTYYRDGDGDGFGRATDTRQECSAPMGYVARTPVLDCDDTLREVKPGATELCNGDDDDCDDRTDEDFPQKGANCTNDICTGVYVCNTPGTALECNKSPVNYYLDRDEDGAGDATDTAEKVCLPGTSPTGKVTNNLDCDDRDPYNRGGTPEVCDDRDNNCANGTADEQGPTNVCAGKGWKKLGDAVTTGYFWNTVALGPGGEPVWIAGDNGALAVRRVGATAFINHHMACGGTRWNAAWVNAAGHVFLAGDGGNLATYSSGSPTCTMASTTTATGGPTSNQALRGIVGFTSGNTTTVYVLDAQGRLFAWTPGSAPVFKIQSSLPNAQDLHGASASHLLMVGHDNPNTPMLYRYDATHGSLAGQGVNGVPQPNQGGVLGVWSWANNEALAVGKKGLVLWWDGNSNWHWASQNGAMQVDLNSIAAPDFASVYIASEDGKIRRPVFGGTGWVEHYTVPGTVVPLKDIAANSRQNIWAVGSQTVVHFPE